MSGEDDNEIARLDAFSDLIERLPIMQIVIEAIKRSEAHDHKVDDKINTLESKFNCLDHNLGSWHGALKSEIQELRERLKSGDLLKENPSKKETLYSGWKHIEHGDIYLNTGRQTTHVIASKGLVNPLLFNIFNNNYSMLDSLDPDEYKLVKKFSALCK